MSFLFYIFAAIAIVGGIGVVVYKNPVTSAFSMVFSFLGLAALFIQLDAYLVGTLQILVYAGAIMVLFLFIIMLLDVPEEEQRAFPRVAGMAAGVVGLSLIIVIMCVLNLSGIGNKALPALEVASGKGSSDVHRIGELLFSQYWFPIEIVGLLLLVATVGVVVLSRKELR